MEVDPYLISYTKINSKWVEELNIRPEIIKLKKTEDRLLEMGLGKDVLDVTHKTQARKAKTNK